MSQKKGCIPWNKGIVDKEYFNHFKEGKIWNKGLTKETDKRLKKQSELLKGKTYEELYGKEKTTEIKRKQRLKKLGCKRKPHTEATKRKLRIWRAKQIYPKKDTTIEIKIQGFLKQLNIFFLKHKCIKDIKHLYQCDIFIPNMNLVIECDGDYWHNYPDGREIDHIRNREMTSAGINILRMWERDIRRIELDDFKDIMEKLNENICCKF